MKLRRCDDAAGRGAAETEGIRGKEERELNEEHALVVRGHIAISICGRLSK